MENSDFYVTLASNVTNKNYSNSISNFVTQLPSTILLDSFWRVGLTEIHFTNSWCNLRADNEIKIHDNFKIKSFNSYTALPAGRYDDVESLLDEIRTRCLQSKNSEVQTLPEFGVNTNTRRITMKNGYTFQMDHLNYELDTELKEMLGIQDGFKSSYTHRIITMDDEIEVNPIVSENDTFEGVHSYDLTGGIHSLFVYCDIVDYSIVGDTRSQLLRMAHIPADSRFGDSIVDRFENPHYLPLATKEISSIEIDIKDDSNSPVNFEFGRVKLVLHFKKWKNTT